MKDDEKKQNKTKKQLLSILNDDTGAAKEEDEELTNVYIEHGNCWGAKLRNETRTHIPFTFRQLEWQTKTR